MQSKWVQEEYSHWHWLLTHIIRKQDCFCKPNENRGGYRAADKRHKNRRKTPPLAIYPVCTSWFVAELGAIPPKRHAFSLRGSIMIFLHICVNIGTGQLCVNRSARTADQRFCCRLIGRTLPFKEISYI